MNHNSIRGKERLYSLTMWCSVLQSQDEKNQVGKDVKLSVRIKMAHAD